MRNPSRKLTEDSIVLRILDEIKLQGKTEREVEEAIGLTTGAFTRWKYGESKSYMRYIGNIADYLNLTTEYLLNKEDDNVNESSMSNEEIRLVKMFRKMNAQKRNCILDIETFIMNKQIATDKKIELYLKKCNDDRIVFEKIQSSNYGNAEKI